MDRGLLAFQRDHGLKQDGLMLPGGETATRLDSLVAPLVRATFGAEIQQGQGAQLRTAQEPERQSRPPPEDGNGGDDPNNAHDRMCAELQRQRSAWEADIGQWSDDKLFLANSDIGQLSGNQRARYPGLIREHTGFAKQPDEELKPSDGSASGRKPSKPRNNDDSRDGKSRIDGIVEVLDVVGTIVEPALEGLDQHTLDKEWEAEARRERDAAIGAIDVRINQAATNLDEIV